MCVLNYHLCMYVYDNTTNYRDTNLHGQRPQNYISFTLNINIVLCTVMLFTEVLTCILLARNNPWVTWGLKHNTFTFINYTLSWYFPLSCEDSLLWWRLTANECHGGCPSPFTVIQQISTFYTGVLTRSGFDWIKHVI